MDCLSLILSPVHKAVGYGFEGVGRLSAAMAFGGLGFQILRI